MKQQKSDDHENLARQRLAASLLERLHSESGLSNANTLAPKRERRTVVDLMTEGTTQSRPILFASPLVRAILAGRKTQTRRLIKSDCADVSPEQSPYGKPGDTLWVRERWMYADDDSHERIIYAADFEPVPRRAWRASMHMPRSACRLVLQITDVRKESLADISESDARAEGFDPDSTTIDPRLWFRQLWDRLSGDRGPSFVSSPLVWVIAFAPVLDEKKASR